MEQLDTLQTTEKRAYRKMSWETVRVYNRLLYTETDEIVKYTELSEIIGVKDITSHNQWALISARKRLQKDDGIIFETIRNVGFKRMSNAKKITCGDVAIKKIRRASKRGVDKIKCVDTTDLSMNEKTKLLAHHSLLGAISLFSKEKTIIAVEEKTKEQQKIMNFKPDLSQFI